MTRKTAHSLLKAALIFLLLLILAFAAGYFIRGIKVNAPKTASPLAVEIPEGEYVVMRVIDGDTVVLANDVHVRYLGLDAPEKNARWGLTASEHNRQLVLNKKVRLELDQTTRDAYGRLLAYLWLGEEMVNEKLLRDGDARAYFIRGEKKLKYHDRLIAAEEWAKDHHYGFWFGDSLQ